MRGGEVLVYDQAEICPYLPGRVARLPLRRPTSPLTRQLLDQRLEEGDRRCGEFLYRTQCSTCRACEPMRIVVEKFTPNRTQERTLRRGNRLLKLDIGPPKTDGQRVDLFNRHRAVRGLDRNSGALDAMSYSAFLEDTCCETLEFRYTLGNDLVAVAVTDIGDFSLSAVYCFYDPALSGLSLGTFSVLKQIELCREWGKRHLYLGLYIAESNHMSYKARFLPHERLIGGEWQSFFKVSSATQGRCLPNPLD